MCVNPLKTGKATKKDNLENKWFPVYYNVYTQMNVCMHLVNMDTGHRV